MFIGHLHIFFWEWSLAHLLIRSFGVWGVYFLQFFLYFRYYHSVWNYRQERCPSSFGAVYSVDSFFCCAIPFISSWDYFVSYWVFDLVWLDLCACRERFFWIWIPSFSSTIYWKSLFKVYILDIFVKNYVTVDMWAYFWIL